MSKLDYFRINFSGRCTMNTGTANNGYFMPLSLVDPVEVKALMPPRIYYDGQGAEKIKPYLPPGAQLVNNGPDSYYLEIAPINNETDFVKWAKTPLGKYPADQAYNQVYANTPCPQGFDANKSLLNNTPCYWDYYGDMHVTLLDCTVTGITAQAMPGQVPTTYTSQSGGAPADLQALFGTRVTFENQIGDPSTTSAVLCDVDPTMAIYSQIFADSLALVNGTNPVFKGKPSKATPGILSMGRVLNASNIEVASGTFQCSIAISDLEGGANSPIIQLCQKYGNPNKTLIGITVCWNIFEIQEDRNPDYSQLGTTPNPARSSIAGVIAPWYSGDMKTVTTGRLLTNTANTAGFPYGGQAVPFTPATVAIDYNQNILSVDLLNCLPEVKNPDGTFQTYDLGTIGLMLITPAGHWFLLGFIPVSPDQWPRENILAKGGIWDFPITYAGYSQDDVKGGELRLVLYSKASPITAQPGAEIDKNELTLITSLLIEQD
ncbi:MAG: hypothetical protein HC842_07385, partial [Cytophagales bacterium]|nr:hypothetical protein [Cytophagales bacterium]